MRFALLRDVSQGRLVDSYRRFGTDFPLTCTYNYTCNHTYSQLRSGCLRTGLTYLQSTAFRMLMNGPDLPTVHCIQDAYERAWPTHSQLRSGCLWTGLTYLKSTAFRMLMNGPDPHKVENSKSPSCVCLNSKLDVHDMVLWGMKYFSAACNFQHLEGIASIFKVNLRIT
jgi:hypothetical protein